MWAGLIEREHRMGLMPFAGCQLRHPGQFSGWLAGGCGLLVIGAARTGTRSVDGME